MDASHEARVLDALIPLRRAATRRLLEAHEALVSVCDARGYVDRQQLHDALERWALEWERWAGSLSRAFVAQAGLTASDGEVLRLMLVEVWTNATIDLYALVNGTGSADGATGPS